MATSFTPTTIIPPTTTRNHRRTTTASASATGNWWSPIFGWSSDPDYIHNSSSKTLADGSVTETTSDLVNGNQCRSRFAPGGFTEEKAKQLRMKTVETVNFHDVMYHSAIASRLASDVSGHGDR